MTYTEALAYLGEARRFGMKLGLEPMRQLAAALDRPQEKLRFIHLAGTNGKGSTAAFCESCLRAAGFRVGLYTSPHLVSVRERIQVDRAPISEADFAKGMAVVRDAVAQTADLASTFFEVMTGLALWSFAREKVDWVVWETGLGGRLDATNIVDPEVCIITNIGLDHQQYLGQTIAEIAAEKAGIIKPRVPVVSGVDEGAARLVIEETAKKQNSPLTSLASAAPSLDLGIRAGRQLARISGHEYRLRLLGSHQIDNAACAVAALQLPVFQDQVSADALRAGLENADWEGRFEMLSEKPLIVLDGAHNPAGVRSLVATWNAFLASREDSGTPRRARLVFSSVADKDITEMAALLLPLAAEVCFVQLGNERGADPETMAGFFPGVPHTFHSSVADLWRELQQIRDDSATLITGSLFLVGEVLAQRQGSTEEYKLNERLVTPLIR